MQKLQRERKIIIRACDKGAGGMILDFNEYLKACYLHLTSELTPGQPYYTPENEFAVERAKVQINSILKEGLDNNLLTKHEADAMNPDDKEAGRFYCNFKVQKYHTPMTAPPERPIVSQSGSICEGIVTYVEHHLKHLGGDLLKSIPCVSV